METFIPTSIKINGNYANEYAVIQIAVLKESHVMLL